MSEENKNVQSREQRMERKLELAKDRDTRVVFARTGDTHMVLDIARQADRGIRILRNGVLTRFKPDEVLPLIENYHKAMKDLSDAARAISVKTNTPYKEPRGLDLEGVGGEKAVGE